MHQYKDQGLYSLEKNTPSYSHRDRHYKSKTVVKPSQVYNGDPFTNKASFS